MNSINENLVKDGYPPLPAKKNYFESIATLIRIKRGEANPPLSQSELAVKLGYKNGQFVSNAERALCSLPLKEVKATCEILKISKEEMKAALIRDYEVKLNFFLEGVE